MTKFRFINSKTAIAAFLFVCLFAVNSFAQAPPKQTSGERNYEVVLQILSASNDAGDRRAETVPQTLAGVVKRLKTMYSFSNYRLNLTYLQRVANTGNLDFKGVLTGANQDAGAPVFSEFSFRQLYATPDEAGQNSISILNFRFGQRVPIKTANLTDANGAKTGSVINYEQVGLSMARVGLPVNTPTIIGNLSAAKADELSFLILTIKPTE